MKKLKRIVTALVMLTLLCGCMNMNIKYEITNEFLVKVSYEVQVDLTEIPSSEVYELKGAIMDVVTKYEKKGFVITGDYKEVIDFKMNYEKQAESYEEAYKILEELMTDPEISIFLSADMNTKAQEYEQAFFFNFETDIAKILDESGLNVLPPTIKNGIYKYMENSAINLSVIMPRVNVVEIDNKTTVEHTKKNSIFSTVLSFEEATIMDFVARMSLDDGRVIDKTIDESIESTQDQIKLYGILLYVGIAVAVLSVAVLIYLKTRKKKVDDVVSEDVKVEETIEEKPKKKTKKTKSKDAVEDVVVAEEISEPVEVEAEPKAKTKKTPKTKSGTAKKAEEVEEPTNEE